MLIPEVASDWWTIATNPSIGEYHSNRQQPMDFSIWKAADGTWQLGACIRNTLCGGHGRLLWRWQTDSLEATNWASAGMLLKASVEHGETLGGLQAPFVIRQRDRYLMFYGDWINICTASSTDGKKFTRILGTTGFSAVFGEGADANTRDPMVFFDRNRYYAYYTGVVDGRGAIYVRQSRDLVTWGRSTVVSCGGDGGSGPADAECAFVCRPDNAADYYLFRWHSAGLTNVYRSDDPTDFGIDHDGKLVATMPVEVARVIVEGDRLYVSSLLEDYSGMRLARLRWVNTK